MFLCLLLIFQTNNKTQGKKCRWWNLALHDAVRSKCSTLIQWKWVEWLSYLAHGENWDSDGGADEIKVFWNVLPCQLVCCYWHSVGICCLRIQGQQYNFTLSETHLRNWIFCTFSNIFWLWLCVSFVLNICKLLNSYLISVMIEPVLILLSLEHIW
jgi:hypothetical protein